MSACRRVELALTALCLIVVGCGQIGKLFGVGSTVRPGGSGEPYYGLTKYFAVNPGVTCGARVVGYGAEIDLASLSATEIDPCSGSAAPVPLDQIDFPSQYGFNDLFVLNGATPVVFDRADASGDPPSNYTHIFCRSTDASNPVGIRIVGGSSANGTASAQVHVPPVEGLAAHSTVIAVGAVQNDSTALSYQAANAGDFSLTIGSDRRATATVGGTSFTLTCAGLMPDPAAPAPLAPLPIPTPSPVTQPAQKTANIIYCERQGTAAAAGNAVVFNAADCGGTLPDATYAGALARTEVAGGNGGFNVFQPSQGKAPEVWFFALAGGGAFTIGAFFVQASGGSTANPPMILCRHNGTTAAGANAHGFSPADCGGAIPDQSYVGMLTLNLINGGNEGFKVNQPVNGESPGMSFWADAGSAAFSIAALYVPMASQQAIFCETSGTTAPGVNKIYFTPGDCGGTLPDATYLGGPSRVGIAGGNSGFTVFQPSQGKMPGMAFDAKAGAANYTVSAVYIKKP